MRTLLALALLATFVVQGAQETPSGAPEKVRTISAFEEAAAENPALRGASHGVPTSLPAAALPSTGAPVSESAISGEVGTALIGGWISWAELDLGNEYVATRFPRGTIVEICAVHCIVRVTTDFGPSAAIEPPRIADVAVLDWEAICALPRTRGVCRGTVEAIEITLPATDTR